MTLSEKDQRLLLFLLPALVAAAYGFFWARPSLKAAARLTHRLEALGDTQTLLQRRDQLNDEQTRLRKTLADAEARTAASLTALQSTAEDPAEGLRRLQLTFHRNGVRLISATVDAKRDSASQPDGVATALRRTGVLQPKIWTVTAEASYTALLQLLDDCSTNRLPIVPETLSMRLGSGDRKTTYWTLTVCL